MSALEAAIESALTRLSAGTFQRLAEGYCELRWPSRYAHLVPQGRNPFDATTTGWPDAWSRGADGGIHAVEMTKDAAWSKHLASDIAKAETLSDLASFVFVSTANPRRSSLELHLEALRELGLADRNINLVFRKQLVRDLADSRFARLRAHILGLPATPTPFVAIEHARNLYSDGSTTGFAPTREEFAKPNRVWRNEAMPIVVRRLREENWAYIEGRGAAGKTVMCVQIALSWTGGVGAAYYLDVADGSADLTPIVEAMVTYGGPGVLFVVDNVHSAQRAAGGMFDDWSHRQDGSALLLSGRHVSSDPWSGVGDPISDLRQAAVLVRATSEDVFGTYRRLAARVTSRPSPPTRYLTRRWAQLFEGDLVAFAVALSGKLEGDVLFSDLSPEDAVDYVRSRYLRPYPDANARAALTTVAALGALDLATPSGLVDAALLEPSLTTGAVLRLDGGLALAHAGLGRLLLAAQHRPTIDIETLAEASHAHPGLASSIARRLAVLPSRREYLAFWQAAVRIGDWAELLPDSLGALPDVVQAVRAATDTEWADIDTVVADSIDWFAAAASTRIGRLRGVIGLCGARLPRSSRALEGVLFPDGAVAPWMQHSLASSDDATRLTLRRLIDRFHPGVAAAFADFVGPEPADAIVSDVDAFGVTPETDARIALAIAENYSEVAALDAGLSELGAVRWEGIVATAQPRAIHRLIKTLPLTSEAIRVALARPSLPAAWIDGQFRSVPKGLVELHLLIPGLHSSVVSYLVVHGDAEYWANRMISRGADLIGTNRQASRTFGDSLALAPALGTRGKPFVDRLDAALTAAEVRGLLIHAIRVQTTRAFGRMVRAAHADWPLLDGALGELATNDSLVRHLAREVCNAELSDVELALADHPLSAAVATAIRLDLWRAGRGVLEVSAAFGPFPVVTRALIARNRIDLAQALAEQAAEAIVDGDIPAERVGLTHAASLFALVPRTSLRLRADVASTLGTDDWAASAASDDVYELSNQIYGLAISAPELMTHLDGICLCHDMDVHADASRRSGLLRLLGSTSLLSDGRPPCSPEGLSAETVNAILARPAWRGPCVSAALAQTLLGAIALTSAGVDVQITREHAHDLIVQCDATEPTSPEHRGVLETIRIWAGATAVQLP